MTKEEAQRAMDWAHDRMEGLLKYSMSYKHKQLLEASRITGEPLPQWVQDINEKSEDYKRLEKRTTNMAMAVNEHRYNQVMDILKGG